MAYKMYSLLFITLGLFNIVQGIAIFSENSDVICYRYVYLYHHIDCVPKEAFLKVSTASTTAEVVEETSTTEKMIQNSNESFEKSSFCENVLIVIGSFSALMMLGLLMIPKIHESILYFRRKREYENLDGNANES